MNTPAVSLSSSISLGSNSLLQVSNHKQSVVVALPSLKHKSSTLCCQADNHAIKKISYLLAQTTALTTPDPGRALMETRSLVMSPNGKDFLSTDGQSTAVVEMHDEGIGIVKFLRQKTFLITGATGFLGKVLIEKILRTAPDVQKIFVLIKAPSKEAAAERLNNEIIEAELFKRLNQIHGKSYQAFMLSKLVPVMGNVCESNLGIDEEDAGSIAKEVDVIINSAANTAFDERYDTALDINTAGPTRILGFAKQFHKLRLFLQVSTAYVNGQRQGRIMEQPFYPGESIQGERASAGSQQELLPKLIIEDEIKLVFESKQVLEDDSQLQKLKELGKQRANKFGWQDAYVFTKAMGEMMIDGLRGSIPVVIIRPSVIESTYREPFPGWMEGNRMMDPIILHYGKGHLTGFLADPAGVLDVVPADMVVNAILAAMAKHGEAGKPECNIYQVASSVVNPLALRDLAKLLYEHFSQSPLIDSTGNPVHVTPMKLFSSMEDFGTHLWRHAMDRTGLGAPANLDRKLSEKLEIICRKSVEQAKYLANIYKPYTFYSGRFDNSNTRRLMGCMSAEERQQFGFEVESIDWKEYICKVHIPGLRRHVMKGRCGQLM